MAFKNAVITKFSIFPETELSEKALYELKTDEFVVKDNGDGTITTLEGNTSGEAGGSCVAIHTDRQRSIVYGYATPVKK